MLEKILKRMMINTELISYNNDLEFLIIGNERKVIINSFCIFNNPIFSAFIGRTGQKVGDSGLQGVEMTKEKLKTLKEFVNRLLQEVIKEIVEEVTDETIENIKYVLEFHNVLTELEYYPKNKIIIYYEEEF